MKLLLDTQAFIWWDSDPARLSPAATIALRDPANMVLLSAASVWEMVIKLQLGKLTLRLPLADIVAQQQQDNGMLLLPLTTTHALAVARLPAVHKDPFDRALAAQAITEGAELVSADAVFAAYPIRVVW
jgi:PIN domain nuclease of toxin-antitoxin system